MFTGMSPSHGVTVTVPPSLPVSNDTVTRTSSMPNAPSSSVTVSRNVSVVGSVTVGAVNVAIGDHVSLSVTVGPAICVHS